MSATTNWTIDPGHTSLQFSIRHLAITTVKGNFNKFKGDVVTSSDEFNDASVQLTIETHSIDTRHPDRDKYLQSPDFFDVSDFPLIGFKGALKRDGNDCSLIGDLTIKGVTKSITLKAEFGGIGTGRFGDTRAGFELEGKINRKDFGLNWNFITDGGGAVLGDEVKLHFTVQLIKAS